MHAALLDAMARQPEFRAAAAQLPERGTTLELANLPGSSTALLLGALARRHERRIFTVVAHSPPDAEAFEADLHALIGEAAAVLFPQRETLPYEAAEHHLEVGGLRVEAAEALLSGRARIMVTTARALQELADIPAGLAELRLSLRRGERVPLAGLTGRLDAMGFSRVTLVEAVGQYAVRGGIVDLFGFGAPDPVRIEFWGDELESIRRFDILDQRSVGELDSVDILPVDLRAAVPRPAQQAQPRRSLLDVISADTVLVELAAGAAERDFERTWEQVQHLHEAARKRGDEVEPPDTLFLSPAEACARMHAFGRIVVHGDSVAALRFDIREAEPVERDMERLATLLRVGAARGEETHILCDNAGQLERLDELLATLTKSRELPAGTTLALGAVHAGFVLEGADPPVRVLTDHEIFRRARRLRRVRRFRGAVALESLSQLRPGDFVVHLDHGVGRFQGMEHVRVGGAEIESLAIEYASGETLRVPVYRLDLIERWVGDGEDARPPKLHKIGGRAWKNLRARTEQSIQLMASELLQLYAQRQLAERPPYSADSRWQKELESSFLYDDTPDQRQATADVKRDMESRRPMDRLLCGDVGYGKTEIAIRAAFKAVQDGRQVALLAPTTILAEQHLHTFRERLAGYPVRIESLSRFRSAKEQERIIAGLAAGVVDIVVGTHRLLEPDVVFRNLGLLVTDEEQRFGVKQKERFKELKKHLDVLALTATPIPRTLHLSLTGLRDLSLLRTPPRDRMPVITHVLPWVDEVIQDAILRELDRGGQVFFLHNRVQSINIIAAQVRALVPDARIGIAHGQMPPHQLDTVMARFLDGTIDILVTTAIIENGLDVPSANTLIVDRADQFGLAQLYQIRGRVGRSHHRAYCYLLTPDDVNDEAEKRLRILEHYTELGSGYAVALKDMELRGAGNLLGAEQSGFVSAVGLDTYTRLLEDTIRRMRGEVPADLVATEVSIGGSALLPDGYVADGAQKLHLYRRLSRVATVAEVTTLQAEVRDRYGPPPAEVEHLFLAARLRLLGTALGIERILIQGDAARVTFGAGTSPRLAVLQNALRDQQVDVEVRRPVPLSLVLRRHGAADIGAVLAAALEILAAERARAA
ncbi:MAG TPA: transcription-repair coupling factor [Longimicrobiales bacterium]|nr:transcription-repair coupling factor [Longimicrobiales bacterium]